MTLRNYISERIDTAQRQSLFETIRPLVAEFLQEDNGKGKIKIDKLVDKLMKNDEFKKKAIAYLTDSDAMDSFSASLGGKTYSSLDNISDGSKRRQVTQRLKDNKIDHAPLAYELWPSMSQDAARSWFSKKVNGKDGESFNDEEISKLYSLLNNVL